MQRLKKACDKRGITIKELAKRAGLSEINLYHLNCNSKKNITLEIVDDIYKASGITPYEYSDFKIFKV